MIVVFLLFVFVYQILTTYAMEEADDLCTTRIGIKNFGMQCGVWGLRLNLRLGLVSGTSSPSTVHQGVVSTYKDNFCAGEHSKCRPYGDILR